jgi:hypothetical protein
MFTKKNAPVPERNAYSQTGYSVDQCPRHLPNLRCDCAYKIFNKSGIVSTGNRNDFLQVLYAMLTEVSVFFYPAHNK